MAKKKSKTARKQQHVAHKLAHSFAKKLGVSMESQRVAGQHSSQEVVSKKGSPKKVVVQKKGTKISKKAGTTKRDRRAQKRHERILQQQSQKKQSKSARTEEADDDFGQEHANVQARGRAAIKGLVKASGTSTNTSTTATTKTKPLQFDQPTFALYDHQKTTPQLLDETTRAVTALWGSAGSNNGTLSWGVPSNNQQVTSFPMNHHHPQAPPPSPMGLKPAVGIPTTTTTSTTSRHNNAFAVLDDDEEEEKETKQSTQFHHAESTIATTTTTTPFTLAPPSFVFPNNDHLKLDHDPDL
jgi:hypothetical protein